MFVEAQQDVRRTERVYAYKSRESNEGMGSL